MDAHGLALDHLHVRGRIRNGTVANGLGVDEGLVAKIEQVIDEEAVVSVHMVIAFGDRPLGIVHPVKIGNCRGIGALWVAHPDPHEGISLVHRIDPHPRLGGDRVLARDVDTFARRIEPHAMVAALDDVAVERAERQRDVAMRTAILHRDHPARDGAVEHHPVTQQAALEQAARHFRRIRHDVPTVGHEHRGHPPGTISGYAGYSPAMPLCVAGLSSLSMPSSNRLWGSANERASILG